MKQLFFLGTLLILTCTSYAQTYQEDFVTAFQADDTTRQLEILQAWESETPEDPELFTHYFNYYVFLAREEILSLTTEPGPGDHFNVSDDSGENVGFLGSTVIYRPEVVAQGLAKIDEGIRLHPDRLDMRFGKIHVLGLVESWDKFEEGIIQTIRHSEKNGNQWTWTDNVPKADGKNFMLAAIQDYQQTLFRVSDEERYPQVTRIAEEVLKLYPDDVPSLSNIGVVHLLQDDLQPAMKYFKKARKISPDDPIILTNLAYTYLKKGKEKKAIKLYQRVVENHTGSESDFAREQLRKLGKEDK